MSKNSAHGIVMVVDTSQITPIMYRARRVVI
jgi:hypothetical protein